jgi:hypothetical protein
MTDYEEFASALEAKQNRNIATIRTTVNGTVLAAVLALIAKLTGWEVSTDELLPYVPALVPIIAVFYRVTLWLSVKFPSVAWVLFGKGEPPKYK